MSGIGHNSGSEDDTFAVSDEQLGAANQSAEELRLLIERIERLEEEKKGIADDIKDVYSEGKAKGVRYQDDAKNHRPPKNGPGCAT